tara:strand:+ start:597 stop:1136 length:540 start_codon:yes stop_codon:yes gene_type:complete
MNKKGQTNVPLFTLITVGFLFVIILGSFLYFFGIVDDSLSGDIVAGQVNVSNSSANTIGRINDSFLSSADLIGIFFLFGVIFSIIIAGFLTRNSTIKLMFMVDFLLLIFAYILAVYISNSYESLLTFLPFSDLIASNLNNTSRFILFLPVITVVTGFITMILTYAGIPRTREEAEVAGF